MLDISFYPAAGQPAHRISVAENFLMWLAQSQFSKIGQDCSTTLALDDKPVNLLLVRLSPETRTAFIDFLNEAIVEQTKRLLESFNAVSPQDELAYRLKKLIDILDCLKSDTYQYLQRL